MAPRPFGRQSKGHPGEGFTDDESNGIEFFSNNPGLPEAGWYPDAADPGTKRYWDGFHWTGQTVMDSPGVARVEESVEARAEEPAKPEQSSIESALPAAEISVPQPPTHSPAEGPAPVEAAAVTPAPGPAAVQVGSQLGDPPTASVSLFANLEQPFSPRSPGSGGGGFAAKVAEGERATPEDGAIGQRLADDTFTRGGAENHDDSVSPAGRSGNRSAPETADEANRWAEKTERAVARAREAGSPEAWQEAARAALVVSELAQIMQAVTHAKIAAGQAAHAAHDAAQQAEVASKKLLEANRSVERTAKAAEAAANQARAAENAAADAKRESQQAALEAPKSAGLAKAAAQVAADAECKAKAIDEIVAKARAANTPGAWTEAVQLVAAEEQTRQPPVSNS